MNPVEIHTERTVLAYPDEPTRKVRVRIERPAASATGPRPFAVLLHGFKGFMDWGFFPYVSRRFAEAGFVAVSMNASGCGVGDDPLEMDDDDAFFRDTYSRELEDLERVRRHAASLDGVDASRELLFGHSRGGGMVALAAAERAPGAVVTWASIDDADRVDDEAKRAWRRDGVLLVPNARTGQIHRISTDLLDDYESDPGRFDIVAAAGRIACPWLVLHGEVDSTVPVEAAQRLADAAPRGEARIVPGGDHGLGAAHPLTDVDARETLLEAVSATLDFAGEHVGGAGRSTMRG